MRLQGNSLLHRSVRRGFVYMCATLIDNEHEVDVRDKVCSMDQWVQLQA